MKWTDSKAVRYVFGVWLSGLLIQLGPMLAAHKIDWYALGATTLPALGGILVRVYQPDVEAPLDILNKNNVKP